ncbi:hypothetical protein CYY_007573 [Polysphondylium violaceum]|uniref:Origin recognition complex subunit 5 C-terminal domain-containing protein n=1 Tax=Polysphondylium violaceum TaxID=133409 RepID=A0A8J4PPK4_9MYCE|nr:hypothetical protein CYY_007573 [Polysphondylium violaceum]
MSSRKRNSNNNNDDSKDKQQQLLKDTIELGNRIKFLLLQQYRGVVHLIGPYNVAKLPLLSYMLKTTESIYCYGDCSIVDSTPILFQGLLSRLFIPDQDQVDHLEKNGNQQEEEEEEEDDDQESEQEKKKREAKEEEDFAERFSIEKPEKRITIQSVPTILEFLELLHKKTNYTTKTINIVLENVEKLVDLERNFIYLLFRTEEIVPHIKVCFYFLSDLPLADIVPLEKIPRMPKTLYFSPYSQEAMQMLISNIIPPRVLDFGDEFSIQDFRNLVDNIVIIFYSIRRSPAITMRAILDLYPIYMERLKESNDKVSAFNFLTESIRTYLRQILLDEPNSNNFQDNYNHVYALDNYTKCLAICCYLASTYSKKNDVLLYGKDKVKRTAAKEEKKTKKKFSFYRIKNIFLSLFSDRYPNLNQGIELYMHMSTLVSLQFIQNTSSNVVGSPQYRCMLQLTHVMDIAKSINFDLQSYINLAEFNNNV